MQPFSTVKPNKYINLQSGQSIEQKTNNERISNISIHNRDQNSLVLD